jgi:YidC/Oxa1 family membrane protein insertase
MLNAANLRVVLWGLLAGILFLCYQTWQHDYAPPPIVGSSSAPAGSTLGESVPQSGVPTAGTAAGTASTAPVAPVAQDGSRVAAPTLAAADAAADAAHLAAPVHVRTDVLDIDVNLKGGELDRADLLRYPLHKDTPNIPVRLLSREPDANFYVIQSGLAGSGNEAAPTHLATWRSANGSYELAPGADELRVPLTWSDGNGLTVTKTFIFKRGLYSIGLQYEVDNTGSAPRSLAAYSQLLRHWEHASRSYFDVETYSFKGPAIYDGSKSRDLNVEKEDDAKFSGTFTNGWAASLQHQFVSAIVPPSGQAFTYHVQVKDKEYLVSAMGPAVQVPAGGKASFSEEMFVGPKLQSQLALVGNNLARSVDFGILTVIAQPLFAGLNYVHKVVGNWGFSIIIVTALIKLLFYPLSQASGRSMAKMRAVQPRLKQIQDTYKDDREKLGKAMMELYKKEKINPLAGCLPMVVQIPVFISFYRVLLESVEMRQAPFMLWINDLSSRDPYFVLPLIMGGAMFAQFKLNPAPPDPTQAKIMQFMPLVMTGMMAWFPSGLVLYWLTNTLLTILQQWRVNQVVEAEAAKPRS